MTIFKIFWGLSIVREEHKVIILSMQVKNFKAITRYIISKLAERKEG